MKKNLVLTSLIFIISLAITSCGGGGASTTINVTFTDFMFEPTEFTIPAGQEITVNATNNGAVEHEFVIFNYGETAGDSFDDEDEAKIYWEVEAEPGQSITTSFTAPSQPGEYYVTCGIEGHLEAGMVGKVIVVAAE